MIEVTGVQAAMLVATGVGGMVGSIITFAVCGHRDAGTEPTIIRASDEEVELAKKAARMLRADHLQALGAVARDKVSWPFLVSYNWRFYGKKAS